MMDMTAKQLPLGISDFERICHENYYYVDKTMFIRSADGRGVTFCSAK